MLQNTIISCAKNNASKFALVIEIWAKMQRRDVELKTIILSKLAGEIF
jgi:hypothetical protein